MKSHVHIVTSSDQGTMGGVEPKGEVSQIMGIKKYLLEQGLVHRQSKDQLVL